MQPPRIPGYTVLGPIARGATATVWRGRRDADAQAVALKVLDPVGGDVAAGLREAGMLARVRHPHVIHLYDVLPLPDPVTGRPAQVVIATQLADGGSLAQMLAARALLSPGELVTVLAPIAGALADLHRLGVVHGDLSTGNVLLLGDGMPVLADLGTARVAGLPPGERHGTDAWEGMVAPEVLEGFAPGPESDVYQVGALAWLSLTGRRPGPLYERTPLEELQPALPEALVALVNRCLAQDPEQRPEAEEVAIALHAVAEPVPVDPAPDADPGHGLTERLRQEGIAATEEEHPQRRLHPWAVRRGASRPRGRGRPGSRLGLGRGADAAAATERDPGWRPLKTHTQGARAAGTAGPATGSPRRSPGGGGRRQDEPARRPVPGARILVSLALLAAVSLGVAAWVVAGPALSAAEPHPTAADSTAADPRSLTAATQTPSAAAAATVAPVGETTGGGAAEETAGGAPEEGALDAADETAAGESPNTGAGAAPVETPSGLQRDLQLLVDARAAAWEAGDPALLAEAMAEGSPALAADTSELEALAASGARFARVRFEVAEVGEPVEEDGVTRVRARVLREELEAVAGEDWVSRSPAREDEVDLVLATVDGELRLWSWEPVG